MPRIARPAPKDLIYHALNRAVARLPLFQKETDDLAFERVLVEAHEHFPVEMFADWVMPNHRHFVLRPTKDGTDFLRWLAHAHTMRWQAHYHTCGTGHLYEGRFNRFKAFPIGGDEHFYMVVRYVERNSPRAGLVERAEDWRWSSLWRNESGGAAERALREKAGRVRYWYYGRHRFAGRALRITARSSPARLSRTSIRPVTRLQSQSLCDFILPSRPAGSDALP
ncbi:MAG TPA: transposase [Pirellulales bacterium]|jgi:putative transposase|nr:transposase [Pirellulales bacterium]